MRIWSDTKRLRRKQVRFTTLAVVRIVIAICAIVASFTIAAASSIALLENWVSAELPSFAQKAFSSLYVPVAPVDSDAVTWDVLPNRATLTIMLDQRSRSEGEFQAIVMLKVSEQMLSQLCTTDLKPISTDGKSLLPQYRNASLVIVFDDNWSRSPIDIVVPLSRLYPPTSRYIGSLRHGTYTATIVLPTWGSLEWYPNDWHVFDGVIDIRLPDRLILLADALYNRLPLSVEIAARPGLAQKRVYVAQQDEGDATHLSIMITRTLAVRVMVYALSGVPIVLSVILFDLLFIAVRETRALTIESFVGIAVVILTVLPLRLVLVPEEIHVLTRVDILLAFGVAVTIGFTAMAYAVDLWVHRGTGRTAPVAYQSNTGRLLSAWKLQKF